MRKPDYSLRCEQCSFMHRGDAGLYKCSQCGSPLEAVFQVGTRGDVLLDVLQRDEPRGMWRYGDLLPINHTVPPVTMGEGDTPLIAADRLADHLGIARLLVKWEGANPTGTFKDRCMSVAVTKVLEFGGNGVVLGSAGNAASSAAAYAARAGLPCYVLVPHTTPSGRVAQTMVYGAKVVLVRGSVNDCIDLIGKLQLRYGWHNVTTARCHNPYQAEGPKTIGYEIARDMAWETPDYVLAPVGGGGLLAAVWKAYTDLHGAGFLKNLPRMVGVQAAGCAPLVRAYQNCAPPECIEWWGSPETVAKAIADPYPLDGNSALRAIYDSGGLAISVSDEEILNGQGILAQTEGIFAEAASSTTIAAVIRLVKERGILDSSRVVCIASGTGLKDVTLASGRFSTPPTTDPQKDDIIRALEESP